MNLKKIFVERKYFGMALDPIYVGTGGYRIGRVDNTIVREPATGIPKIPGTTIAGVSRMYASLKAREEGEKIGTVCSRGKPTDNDEPCGKCRICITFGYTRKDKSMQAMALFSDAHILFFPVATMVGPVWVTCPTVLYSLCDSFREDELPNSLREVELPMDKFILLDSSELRPPEGKLNFGWLLLDKLERDRKIDVEELKYCENRSERTLAEVIPLKILKRMVIVSDDIFPVIVNSNLEVRTSVAIDPERGAAEEGALYTYEAIPRGTVVWFVVIYQNPKNFPIIPKEITIKNRNVSVDFNLIIETVESSFSLFEYLGVGGMGSRGFGRMKILLSRKSDKNER